MSDSVSQSDDQTRSSFLDLVQRRAAGICLYGLAPPKQEHSQERIAKIAATQTARVEALGADAVVVYDVQDETGRTAQTRPFPFLPTVDPHSYALDSLAGVRAPKVVYRSVGGDSEDMFAGMGSIAR